MPYNACSLAVALVLAVCPAALAGGLGASVVQVNDAGGVMPEGPAQVVPAAGQIPERVHLTISGDPATPDFLASRLNTSVAAAVKPTLAPGSSVRTTAILPQPQQLDRGFLTSFAVAVTIEPGPGTAAVSGWTTVDVVNAALPALAPASLAFADDPERITADGVLSRTMVNAGQPVRMYY